MSKSLSREKLPTWRPLTNEDPVLLCSTWAGGVQRSKTFKDDSQVPTCCPVGRTFAPRYRLHHHGLEAIVETESVLHQPKQILQGLRGWVEPMKVVWLLCYSLLPSQSSSTGKTSSGVKVLNLEWSNVLFCRHPISAIHWATLSPSFQCEEGFMSLSVCLSPFASWGYWIFSHSGAFSEDGMLAYTVKTPGWGLIKTDSQLPWFANQWQVSLSFFGCNPSGPLLPVKIKNNLSWKICGPASTVGKIALRHCILKFVAMRLGHCKIF